MSMYHDFYERKGVAIVDKMKIWRLVLCSLFDKGNSNGALICATGMD